MGRKIGFFVQFQVVFLFLVTAIMAAVQNSGQDSHLPTPKQLWERCQKTLLPINYRIEKDEIINSDICPGLELRRIEVKFYSQEINNKKWGHPCLVFMPADSRAYNTPERRGKVVIVGQRSWDSLATGPWRDLMWYPEFMIYKENDLYKGYVKGKLPDAWLVEVKDIASGFPGYLSSLPQDITGKKTAARRSHGSRSRLWEPKKKR